MIWKTWFKWGLFHQSHVLCVEEEVKSQRDMDCAALVAESVPWLPLTPPGSISK